MEILTLTFNVELTPGQAKLVDRWLELSRPLWNFALGELEKLDHACVFDKESKTFVPRSIVYKSWDALKTHGVQRGWNPTPEEIEQGYGRVCPVGEWQQPLLQASGLQSKGGLSLCARSDLLPFEELNELPSKFRMGVLAMLDTSWQEYRKSMGTANGRGKPRYKRKGRDEFDTLYSGNLKKELSVEGNTLVGVPKLKSVVVPGLAKRWKDDHGKTPPIAGFRLLKEDGQYKVQLSGELRDKAKYKPKKTTQAIGIDPGIIYTVATSLGQRKAEDLVSTADKELYQNRLNQRIHHKLDHRCLMWLLHPDRTKDDLTQYFPVSDKTWEKLQAARTLETVNPDPIVGDKSAAVSRMDLVVAAIGANRFTRLKHKLPTSKRQQQLQAKLRKHKSKERRRAKAWDDSWTTYIAKNYAHIAVEDGLQKEKVRHRPESISDDGKVFERNGAKNKAELNKRLSHAAPGRKIALLERKADRFGREFVKVPSPQTTSNCPVCGTNNEADGVPNMSGDRLYKCHCCKWEVDQDAHAAVNVELAAFAANPAVTLSPIAALAKKRSDAHERGKFALWRKGPKGFAFTDEPRSTEGKGSKGKRAKTGERKTKKRSTTLAKVG